MKQTLLVTLARRPVASAVYFLLTLGDIVSTEIAIRSGLREANPLPAWVMATFGRAEMYALRTGLTILVFLAVSHLIKRYPRVWISIPIVNWMVGVVVFSNFFQTIFA